MRFHLVFVCLLAVFYGQGQSSLRDALYLGDPFHGEMFLGLGLNHTWLKNTKVPIPGNHELNAWSGGIELKTMNFAKGGKKYTYEHHLIVDLILLVKSIYENPRNFYQSEGSYISNGYLGWFSQYWNIGGGGQSQWAMGLNLNDYLLWETYSDGGKLKTEEPQGYYLGAGPSFSYQRLLAKNTFLDASFQASVPYLRAASISNADRNNEAKYPWFYRGQVLAQTGFGFYAGASYLGFLNRTGNGNNTRRFELVGGFRFMF